MGSRNFPRWRSATARPTLIDVNGKPQLLVLAVRRGQGRGAARARPDRRPSHSGGAVAREMRRRPRSAPASSTSTADAAGPGTAVDPTGAGDVSNTHIKWTDPQRPRSDRLADHRGQGTSIASTLPGFCDAGRPPREGNLQAATGRNHHDLGEPHRRCERTTLLRQRGKSYVIEAGPEFSLLSVNELADPNHASAAVAGGRIFLEGIKDLYCVGSRLTHAGIRTDGPSATRYPIASVPVSPVRMRMHSSRLVTKILPSPIYRCGRFDDCVGGRIHELVVHRDFDARLQQ